MRTWGRYVGNRYKDFDNIAWGIGGDTDPTPVRDKVLEFVNGIRDHDTRHLFTAGNQSESFAVTAWPNESWLNINNVFSYSDTLYRHCKTAYDRSPVIRSCRTSWLSQHTRMSAVPRNSACVLRLTGRF
jgi:hypothetical protein